MPLLEGMAANIEKLEKRAKAIHDALAQRSAAGASCAQLVELLDHCREACEKVLFANFEHAWSHDTESQLWQAHVSVNNAFRKEHRALKRVTGHPVELRKFQKSYLQFIKTSQRFYRQYILNLDAEFEGIPELRSVARQWKLEANRPLRRQPIPAAIKQKMLKSCHQSLIQLGDLSRYRETELVDKDKDRNWGPAKGFYDLAAELYPDSGLSHNQMAIISREDGDHFRSVYHLYRSLASREPFYLTKGNLELEFKRIVNAWNKGEPIHNHISSDGNNAGRALVGWFIRLHSKCYKGEEFAAHDELEGEVLSQLAIELKERSLDTILQKIVLINLAAEYFSTLQMQAGDESGKNRRAYFYYLRLNVKTFFTLLQVLQPELERLSEGDDVTVKNGDRAPQLADKVTAVARRILPALRLYSTWFARYWHVLQANIASTLTQVDIQELWKAYTATLSLLASSFPAPNLPKEEYMLEEDIDTIGFQPLECSDTMGVWYTERGAGHMKPKLTEVERNHPNAEMLMRVRDLLIDGLLLSQNPEAPVDLDGNRFIYREEGLPSELFASPNNRNDASPAVVPEPVDLPLVPTEGPVPDDQQSQGVVAPSESASTTLAKDSAMNRMVDDLVGPDDGLDPLPEEDENIPPTPPEQTFEDTAVVPDNNYAPAAFSISDIVNTVQNYRKSTGPSPSPAAAATAFSVPMNRGGSSSSIRQPANLPSLPDGQWNANSIWNRNFNGTPGPSSPLLPNGSAHEVRSSPLNGMHSSGSFGHARGNSSTSIRSTDLGMPSAMKTQRLSGGLGDGAAWGNSTSPSWSSIYGNSFNQNRYGFNGGANGNANINDLNNMSPFLFKSSYQDQNPSSWYRTPPNGQGG